MNTTMVQKSSSESVAEQIIRRLSVIRVEVAEVAKLYVDGIEADPELRSTLREAGISDRLLDRLERIGRGQALAELYDATYNAANRIMLLPLSLQKDVVQNGVDVLDVDEKTIRRIPVNNLTPDQSRRVFQAGRVTSIAEQRTIIIREKVAKTPPQRQAPAFTIKGDCVRIMQPGIFTKAEVLGWIAQMR